MFYRIVEVFSRRLQGRGQMSRDQLHTKEIAFTMVQVLGTRGMIFFFPFICILN